MVNIDNVVEMQKLDPSGVLASTAMFPDQCEQAWKESSIIKFSANYGNIYNIAVSGMGGSRFTPKTIKELFRDRIKEPYEVVEDYSLPAYVDKDTLVILSSYSGTTEEVLACAQDAKRLGAKLTGVMKDGSGVITSFIKDNAIPAYLFNPQHNPCGQPRIGGGYLLMGHLGLLKALKLLIVSDDEVEEAINYARLIGKTYLPEIPTENNPAKQLAIILKDTHPFIVTSEFLRGFGNGFANQINETAKMISDPRHISELNHHMMEGLKRPDTLKTNGIFLFIYSQFYSPQVIKRYEITRDVVEKQGLKTKTIGLTGKSKLAQVLEAYTLSGFTTFYLAMLYDTDPVAIPWVDYFKAQLSK